MGYAVRGDVELVFGTENVEKWADVDNDGNSTTITNRVTWALSHAEELINARLFDGPYTVPFTTVPTLIKHVCAMLAGTVLYDARRVNDTDATTDAVIDVHRERVESFLQKIHARTLKLSELENTSDYPKAL